MLFRGCLKELLFETFRLKNNFQFLLSLSAQRGENLEISLFIDYDNISSIVSCLDDKIRSYLKFNPAPSEINDYPIKSFFRDISVNNIHYKLFKCRAQESIPHLPYRLILSNLFLKIFSEEDLQDESLMTFSLYLNLGLLKYALACSKNQKIYLSLFRDHIISQAKDCDFCDEKYRENMDEIDTIASDIYSPDFSPDLKWLRPWLDLCQNTFHSFSNEQLPDEILFQKQLDITGIIHQHLNSNKTAEKLVNYFMYQNTLNMLG
jgi:hypothetical protein